MPLIEVRHANSYDPAQRERIIAALTAAYSEASGAPAEKVWVILDEVQRDSWGAGGASLQARDAGGTK